MRLPVLVILPILAIMLLALPVAFSQQDAIPDWIKNTAKWWSEGLVPDQDYVASIQWLVDNGYVVIDEKPKQMVRAFKYSIDQPAGWERQIPQIEGTGGRHDAMVYSDSIEMPEPVMIAVTVTPIDGRTFEEYREWGLGLVGDILGDSFKHISAESVIIMGEAGYVDTYHVDIFGVEVMGITYSFAHEGEVYEIKYEAPPDLYEYHLEEFQAVYDSFALI